MSNDALPIRKRSGIAHALAALRFSTSGACRIWRETAFQHEVIAIAVAMIIYALIGAEVFVFVVSGILFLILIAVEALNTAIEEIMDRVSPEFSITARNAKDLGSFAVLCLLAANGLFFAYAMYEFLSALDLENLSWLPL
ncbi:diacylglycerol kinase [Rhizobium sp. LC145]|uniref:diacylglycerol kinase n=1 Tax=Rhizobium sp. LC145 TaxID=1120688 RepID=UPI00062A4EF8|nr:diacylglycerol kinase [Rhizobium sp. LC145]KKX29330.1 hypothetical protein YH62_16235 [Rhizobium sp. LC145]TKT68942.1 diacylglycerol kinase [Rhizobiaceae bacterium LC148]